ncbi:Hypothetical predicted protein [Cloeon dipterum]|uniref:Uncharacterized protein n=1 Tax=Cloeon dipterum TaxID=197152 RepID=A0A8S1DNF7_9INSE|nr:Hypothetical predicted protein [Cloeon dipterum]
MNGQTPIIVLAQRSPEWFENSYGRVPKCQVFEKENFNTDAPFHPRPRELTIASPSDRELNPFIQCIVHLIDKGADVNLVSDKGSALHIAAENGDLLLVELLLKKGARPSITCYPFNHTPLHCAAQNGHLGVVRTLLLQKDVDIDARSFRSERPVQMALEGGHTAVVEFLLTRGADVTPTFGLIHPDHYILACKAAEMGLRKELEMILGAAPSDGYQRQLDGALTGAARGGKIDLLHDLVQMGANPTHSYLDKAFSWSPLTAAILAGKSESIEALFQLMDAQTQAEEASIALVAAVEKRNLALIRKLVEEMGADINCKDEREFSPITRATQWGIDDIVDYFLNFQHLDLLAPSFNGKTPESFVDNIRNEDIRNRLVSRIMDQKLNSRTGA